MALYTFRLSQRRKRKEGKGEWGGVRWIEDWWIPKVFYQRVRDTRDWAFAWRHVTICLQRTYSKFSLGQAKHTSKAALVLKWLWRRQEGMQRFLWPPQSPRYYPNYRTPAPRKSWVSHTLPNSLLHFSSYCLFLSPLPHMQIVLNIQKYIYLNKCSEILTSWKKQDNYK